jgi:hypothetical protein
MGALSESFRDQVVHALVKILKCRFEITNATVDEFSRATELIKKKKEEEVMRCLLDIDY